MNEGGGKANVQALEVKFKKDTYQSDQKNNGNYYKVLLRVQGRLLHPVIRQACKRQEGATKSR